VCKRGRCNFDSRQEPRARSTPEQKEKPPVRKKSIKSEAKEQRCWNHRLLNILDKLPLTRQAEERSLLTKIRYAAKRDAAKRLKKVENATAVIWNTLLIAEKTFRRLDAPELLADVARGEVYVNGECQ